MIFKTGSIGSFVYQITGEDNDNVTLNIFKKEECIHSETKLTVHDAFVVIDGFYTKEHFNNE